jgi:FemAB-related protein (PEP-CTERM system-associated)
MTDRPPVTVAGSTDGAGDDVRGDAARATVSSRLEVIEVEEAERTAWNAFVGAEPSASGYHAWGWRTVLERTFGHTCVYLAARRNGRLEGVLPLVEIRSRLFGRTLTSLPFVNYGGVLTSSQSVAEALLEAARDTARQRQCRHVELRHVERRFPDLPCKAHKVAMLLPLQPTMWEAIDRKVRNQIRKAEKSGLTVERGGASLLPEFYAVFARNMRDLGTPVYSPRLFDEVLRAFPERTRIVVVRLKGRAVAAGLTFRTASTVEVPWASSIRDFNNLCPNHLLYWHVIESAVAEGIKVLDFGRSTPHEGTYKFKEQWGARPVALHWEYCLLQGGAVPDQTPKNPKFRLAISAWQRLPLWAANRLGPAIVKNIP